MVQDVAALHINEKSNGDSVSDIGNVAGAATNGSPEIAEKNHVLMDTVTDECESAKIIEDEAQNESNLSSFASAFVNVSSVCPDHAHGTEKNDPAVEALRNSLVDSHSPEPEKRMEPNYHTIARKQRYLVSKSHYDEDDNCSLASSTCTSVRTAKITVPVAPRFTCVDRLQRRKEFYIKLEEKHKALEKEKDDFQARTKEEEQSAIKLLRKNMSYKANPVPSFYREGPPAKAELKKIPVTRAKSPNLTRRKSCGEAAPKPPAPEKVPCERATRHSIGTTTAMEARASPVSSKGKVQNQNGSNKIRSQPRQVREIA